MGYDPGAPLIQPFSKVMVWTVPIASTEGLIFPAASSAPGTRGDP